MPGRAATTLLLAKKDRHLALKLTIAALATANILMLANGNAAFGLLLGPVRFAARASRFQNGVDWRLLTGAVGFANLPTAALGLGLSWWLGRFLELKLGHVRLALLAIVGVAAGLAACLTVQPDANNFAALGTAGSFIGAYGAGLVMNQLPRLRLPVVGYGWIFALFFLGSTLVRVLSDRGTLIVLLTSAAVGAAVGRVALSDLTTASEPKQRVVLAVAFVALAGFSAVRASQASIGALDPNAERMSALNALLRSVEPPTSHDPGWFRVTWWEDENDIGDSQSYQLRCSPLPQDKPQASGLGFRWKASNAAGACGWLASNKVPDRGELQDVGCTSLAPSTEVALMSRVQLVGDYGNRDIDVSIRSSGCAGPSAQALELFFPADDR